MFLGQLLLGGAVLIDLIHRVRNRQAIRRKAVSMFIEHQGGALAVAARLAIDPAATLEQRWFYAHVSRRLERLVSMLRDLDTATRYLEYNRLEAEYLVHKAESQTTFDELPS